MERPKIKIKFLTQNEKFLSQRVFTPKPKPKPAQEDPLQEKAKSDEDILILTHICKKLITNLKAYLITLQSYESNLPYSDLASPLNEETSSEIYLDSSHFIAFKLKERLFSDLLNSTEIDDIQSKKIKKDLEIFQCDYLNYSSSVNIAQSLITKSLDSIVKETTIKFENLNNCDTNNPQTDSDVDLIDEDVSSLAYLSTQIKSEPRPVKERDSSGRILHRCDTCSKAFPTRAILVNHVRGIHTNIRPFKCETCGKCFPYKVTLESHRKRIHMGIRPFKCDTCEKTFFSRSNFVIHQRVHTKEKPYACEECGQGFSHLATLISHGRIHTGERPFACESCGKSFSDRSNLKTHAKIHEKENPFKCKECTKGFSSQNNLDEHAKSHLFE